MVAADKARLYQQGTVGQNIFAHEIDSRPSGGGPRDAYGREDWKGAPEPCESWSNRLNS